MELLNYLDLYDYIVVGYLGLTTSLMAIFMYAIIAEGNSDGLWVLYKPAILFYTPVIIVMYFSYIPKGMYQARYIEINGVEIGKGTEGSKAYKFYIDSDKIKSDGYTFEIANKRSNLPIYLDKYQHDDGTIITVTRMGTVKMISKGINATIEVDY
jgi:hypothetical protein